MLHVINARLRDVIIAKCHWPVSFAPVSSLFLKRLTLSGVVNKWSFNHDRRNYSSTFVSSPSDTVSATPCLLKLRGFSCSWISPSASSKLFWSGNRRYCSTSSTRNAESNYNHTFFYKDLKIEESPKNPCLNRPQAKHFPFGTIFSDHMLESNWKLGSGWGQPKIVPFHLIQLHPAAKVLHYAQELFEGLKAYRGRDERIRLFRPELNIERMLASADRLQLPTFDAQEFLRCLMRLVDVDRGWVPCTPMSSLYIRPTLFGIEPTLGLGKSNEAYFYVIMGPVDAYYGTGVMPISLLADPRYVRAWPGGTGDRKVGCNYAPTLSVQSEAENLGLQQVLWLFGDNAQITEVGAMNVFVFLRDKDDTPELVTPPLNGIILPGITRRSVLDIAREWNEFKVSERMITMSELREAHREGRLIEMFGSGTACVILPIKRILYRTNSCTEDLFIPTMESKEQLHTRIMRCLQDIQYGVVNHPWSVVVEEHAHT